MLENKDLIAEDSRGTDGEKLLETDTVPEYVCTAAVGSEYFVKSTVPLEPEEDLPEEPLEEFDEPL